MICEATRTIEDSQTAQALHGLLSLKTPESSNYPSMLKTVSQKIITPSQQQTFKILPAPPRSASTENADIPPIGDNVVVSSEADNRMHVQSLDSGDYGLNPASTPSNLSGSGGSMVQLLLHMQSQADAAAKKQESHVSNPKSPAETFLSPNKTATSTPMTSPIIISSNSPVIQSPYKPTNTLSVSKSMPILQNRPLQITNKNIVKQANSTSGVTCVMSNTTSTNNDQKVVPVHLLTRSSAETANPGHTLHVVQANGRVVPVMQTLQVMNLPSTTTSTSPVKLNTADSNQSLQVQKHVSTEVSNITSTPPKIILKSNSVAPPLPSPQDLATRGLKIVVQKAASGDTIARMQPQTIAIPVHSQPNDVHACPVVKSDSAHESTMDDCVHVKSEPHENVHEDVVDIPGSVFSGYNQVFKYLHLQAMSLKSGNVPDQTMKSIVEDVVTQQIATDKVCLSLLTPATLKYFGRNPEIKELVLKSSIITRLALSDSFEYPCYGSTTIINILILLVRESTL